MQTNRQCPMVTLIVQSSAQILDTLPTRVFALLAFCLAARMATVMAGPVDDRAAEILNAAGVKGGLIVHVGCGDGRLAAALRASDAYLAHALDRDPKNVQAARRHVASLGLCDIMTNRPRAELVCSQQSRPKQTTPWPQVGRLGSLRQRWPPRKERFRLFCTGLSC